MNGEFSRLTFNQSNDYTGVLLQQGCALVDAEWNEQCALLNEQMRRAIADIIQSLGSNALLPTLAPSESTITDKDGNPCLEIGIAAGVFYVHGARCRQRQSETIPVRIHPKDSIRPDRDPFVISLHAWERTVSALEDPQLCDSALQGADSALRSQIVWELQVDQGSVPGATHFASWIDQKRGASRLDIKDHPTHLRHCTEFKSSTMEWLAKKETRHESPRGSRGRVTIQPSGELRMSTAVCWRKLRRAVNGSSCCRGAQLTQDAPGHFLKVSEFKDLVKRGMDSHLAEIGQFFRCWDGCQLAWWDKKDDFIRLDDRIDISFSEDRKYRRGESWLAPYRGEKELDADWKLPTGQHYFSLVYSSSQDRNYLPQTLRTVSNLRDNSDELTDKFFATGKQLRRNLSAEVLANETNNLWLKKWLGTALMSEVLTNGCEQFWDAPLLCPSAAHSKSGRCA